MDVTWQCGTWRTWDFNRKSDWLDWLTKDFYVLFNKKKNKTKFY